MFTDKAKNTPRVELKKGDLRHYEEVSSNSHVWRNSIPIAIEFYYDYRELSLIGRILHAFKKK